MGNNRKGSEIVSRTADYTIQGFLYQLNKTLVEILNAQEGATVSIEGAVEDIEVATETTTTGIQCKYHEAVATFTPSTIYKPLLQMLGHFSAHPTDTFEYVLFAHFPGAIDNPPVVGKLDCKAALASKGKALKKLIKEVPSTVDIDGFVGRFRMEFGPSYEDLVAQVTQDLQDNGIPSDEVETLAYPNAIHLVAGIAIQHDSNQRQVTRKEFLDRLSRIRITAISRWTMALQTRKKLLAARRKQLKVQLDKNTRLRYFVIDPKSFGDFESEIVLFVSDYINKYHFKTALISTPVLCICASRKDVQNIQHRLYSKGIVATDGYVGAQFEESRFFRPPFSTKRVGGTVQREFALRITSWGDHGTVLNSRKCDDLFILGELDFPSLETVDVNVERLAGTTIKEIGYLVGVRNVYE